MRIALKNLSLKKSQNQGQTLIEVTAALTILSIVLTGVIFVFSNSLSLGLAGRDRTQATNLAQQALEAVRMIKDENSCTFFDGSFDTTGGNWRNFVETEELNNNWVLGSETSDVVNGDKVPIPYEKFRRRVYIETLSGSDSYLQTSGIEVCPSLNQICSDQVRKIRVQIGWESRGVPGQGHPDWGTDYQVLEFITYFTKQE